MEPIVFWVIWYVAGFCATVLVTIQLMPAKVSAGASIWWPVTLIWYILYSGITFINWSCEQ